MDTRAAARATDLRTMATLRSAALPLFRFKGIQVRVHWSFFLFPAWVLANALSEGADLQEGLFRVGLVVAVFGCVVLHEYGHALTALHFGVRTRDITLLPIGGVASLERMPEEPRQELLITLAGPAVNLVLVLLLGIPYYLYLRTLTLMDPIAGPPTALGLVSFLIMANTVLFLFNLIPAFPMDGGRILRSLLSMRVDRVKATRIASAIGRGLAVVLMGLALWQGVLMWGLIGLFVFFGAGAEYKQVVMQQALKGLQVRNVLRTACWKLPATATLQQAITELLDGAEQHVLLMADNAPPRLLTRSTLLAAAQELPGTTALHSLATTVPPVLAPASDVRMAYEVLMQGGWPLLPVMEQGVLIGVVEADNLAEYLAVHRLLPQ